VVRPPSLLLFAGGLRPGQRVVGAHTEMEGLLLGGVVARERLRLDLAVVESAQRLDDDRPVAGGVEHAPAPLRRTADADEVVGAVARAVRAVTGSGIVCSS
jgi:hypothetical protein